ncbi:MAG: Rieske (2Fe-2S) protein [Gammaproteobacteria bacterium]|nr:Rieske (2Fe-2S) protein [Gammaproteobacteria bacterium]
MTTTLCLISDITDPGSKSFQLDVNGEEINIFIVHKDAQFHGFINSCPHTGVNLEWLEDQFLDMDQNFIQCSTHDALFEIDTGHCIYGPCAGDNLTPIQIQVVGNRLITHI